MAQVITKAAMKKEIAEQTGLSRSQVEDVLAVQAELIEGLMASAHVGDTIPAVPGVVTVRIGKRKAQKARMGINPSTGRPIKIKAKKAHRTYKARVNKAVRDSLPQ